MEDELPAIGFIWNVYARRSVDGTVAAGVEEHEDAARILVQDVLRHQDHLAAFGVVVDLATGARAGCHRASGDGFTWRKLD